MKSVPCRDNLKFQDNLIPQLIKEACETLKWDPKLCGANSYMSLFLYFQSSLRLQMAIFRIRVKTGNSHLSEKTSQDKMH